MILYYHTNLVIATYQYFKKLILRVIRLNEFIAINLISDLMFLLYNAITRIDTTPSLASRDNKC